MNRPVSELPELPPRLTKQEGDAVALWGELHAELGAKNWRLILRVRGFGASRFLVIDLQRVSAGRHKNPVDCGAWQVNEQQWSRVGGGVTHCPDAATARTLILATAEAGAVIKQARAKKASKADIKASRLALGKRKSNAYLFKDEPQ